MEPQGQFQYGFVRSFMDIKYVSYQQFCWHSRIIIRTRREERKFHTIVCVFPLFSFWFFIYLVGKLTVLPCFVFSIFQLRLTCGRALAQLVALAVARLPAPRFDSQSGRPWVPHRGISPEGTVAGCVCIGCVCSVCAAVDASWDFSGSLICAWACGQSRCSYMSLTW